MFLKRNSRFDSLKTKSESRAESGAKSRTRTNKIDNRKEKKIETRSIFKTRKRILNIKKEKEFNISNELFPTLESITERKKSKEENIETPLNYKEIAKEKEVKDDKKEEKESEEYPMTVLTKELLLCKDEKIRKKSWYTFLKQTIVCKKIKKDILRMKKNEKELEKIYGDLTPFDYVKIYGEMYKPKRKKVSDIKYHIQDTEDIQDTQELSDTMEDTEDDMTDKDDY